MMLANEYFNNLERFCLEKYDISGILQLICDVIEDVIEIIVQFVKFGKWLNKILLFYFLSFFPSFYLLYIFGTYIY